MAPTRPLVNQHRNSYIELMKLGEKDTVILTGKTPPELRHTLWLSKTKVFFSTPQVVRNDLKKNRLNLEDYGLVVFDECHRAVKNYAYTEIARYYVNQCKYPLILGMTASPGSELNRVLDVCRNLYIEHIEYRNEEDKDVKPYVQPIKLEWQKVNLPKEYLEIRSKIRTMLDRRLDWLYQYKIIKTRPRYASRKNLLEAGNELRQLLKERDENERGPIYTAIIKQSQALTLFHMIQLIETQGMPTLKIFLNKIERERQEKRSYATLLNESEYKQIQIQVDTKVIEHPKLELLKQIIKEQIKRNPSSRILTFTQYRDTAKHIVSELDVFQGVRAARFVGQASKITDKGLTQEQQADRIKSLEDGSLNVLVATSIAEEGLDIPTVDHVIFYEPIPSAIRYIQRRGRTGRRAPGKVTILAADNSLDMVYLFASRRKREKMRRITENVNKRLQSSINERVKRKPNPITVDELDSLETYAKEVLVEPVIIENEKETMKRYRKKVESATKSLYFKLLENGHKGADIKQLSFNSEIEGTPSPIIKSAMEKMMKKGLVQKIDRERYAVSSAVKDSKGKTFDVKVEKIYPGSAVLIINEKWRARLMPYDYNGPRNLIKKNSAFVVKGELYRMDGKLCIKISHVTQIK
jgi:Fanconi anemia group M protein